MTDSPSVSVVLPLDVAERIKRRTADWRDHDTVHDAITAAVEAQQPKPRYEVQDPEGSPGWSTVCDLARQGSEVAWFNNEADANRYCDWLNAGRPDDQGLAGGGGNQPAPTTPPALSDSQPVAWRTKLGAFVPPETHNGIWGHDSHVDRCRCTPLYDHPSPATTSEPVFGLDESGEFKSLHPWQEDCPAQECTPLYTRPQPPGTPIASKVDYGGWVYVGREHAGKHVKVYVD